jgi:hypothetical protein
MQLHHKKKRRLLDYLNELNQSNEDAFVSGSGFGLSDKGQLGTKRHRFLSSE